MSLAVCCLFFVLFFFAVVYASSSFSFFFFFVFFSVFSSKFSVQSRVVMLSHNIIIIFHKFWKITQKLINFVNGTAE